MTALGRAFARNLVGCFLLGFLLIGGAQLGLLTLGVRAEAQEGTAAVETSVEIPARASATTPWDRLTSLGGIVVLIGIGVLLSNNRRAISWRLVIWGVALQFGFGLLILCTGPGEHAFGWIRDGFDALLGFTDKGARFLFGNLVQNQVPVVVEGGGTGTAHTGALFAFSVLPTIIFFSSLMTVLYHLGIMQRVVEAMAWVMHRTMKTSGAESLSAAGNIFVGQTEAPLMIKPFVETMTVSELMTVMTGGFATVAGGVMAAYVGMLRPFFPDIAGHLLAASVMSAPAALLMGKIMIPETEKPATAGGARLSLGKPDANIIEAAARGAGEGLRLALNVGAMLLAFIALIAMVNAMVGWLGGQICGGLGYPYSSAWTLEAGLGYLLAPLAWLMGIPWEDCVAAGGLFGIKTVLNEFVAYLQLADLLGSNGIVHQRSIVIVTYALCGFANFSSIAIQIGGIGGIAPSRTHDLARIGLRAMIAGNLAAFMTGTVAGVLL